jgi:hypothetical protein
LSSARWYLASSVASSGRAETGHEEQSVGVDHAAADGITPLVCGGAFEPPVGSGLTLRGRFPASVTASELTVSGTVELVSDHEVRGVVTAAVDVFLAQGGRIVSVPLAQDLVGQKLELIPGRVETLPAHGTLTPCAADTNDGGGGDVQPLPAGSYDLHTRLVINLDDGTSHESFGGPWPLEVR